MKVCCKRNEKEADEVSQYDNKLVLVLFPVTFFCAVGGIAFLCWPDAGLDTVKVRPFCGDECENQEPGIVLILGAVLTGISGFTGTLAIISVCYIHVKNFHRANLAFLTINSDSNALIEEARESSHRPISSSKVVPEVHVTTSTPSKNPSHVALEQSPNQHGAFLHDDKQSIIPSKQKTGSTEGIDNPSLAVSATLGAENELMPNNNHSLPRRLPPIIDTNISGIATKEQGKITLEHSQSTEDTPL